MGFLSDAEGPADGRSSGADAAGLTSSAALLISRAMEKESGADGFLDSADRRVSDGLLKLSTLLTLLALLGRFSSMVIIKTILSTNQAIH